MEKRFVAFLVTSMAIWLGYILLHAAFFPDPVAENGPAAVVPLDPDAPAKEGPAPEGTVPEGPAPEGPAPDALDEANTDDVDGAAKVDGPPSANTPPENRDQEGSIGEASPITQARWTAGSLDPASGYAMLVTFNTQGGAIERVELNNPRYHDLEDTSGYLGHLGLSAGPEGGCFVTAVGRGTPAALAKPDEAGVEPGLCGPTLVANGDGALVEQLPGDQITAINTEPINTPEQFDVYLRQVEPGQEVVIEVDRAVEPGGEPRKLKFSATLVERPMSVMRPDPQFIIAGDDRAQPMSFLTTLHTLSGNKAGIGDDEIPGLASLTSEHWAPYPLAADGEGQGEGIEFRRTVSPAEMKRLGLAGSLQIIKRYRVGRMVTDGDASSDSPPYTLTMELELQNQSDKAQELGYRIQGPTGLPLEGWWYSSKVHPSKWFAGTGARDVVWRSPKDRHELLSCAKITAQAAETPDTRDIDLTADDNSPQLRYVGCDAQFFAVAMLPATSTDVNDPYTKPTNFVMKKMFARSAGPLDSENKKRTEVTFLVDGMPISVAAGESLKHRFTIFAGPKDPDILDDLGLTDCISYGLFGRISRPMVWLLHTFYGLTRNYGIAIVMLTVLVRGALFPLGRKMALNAQKMQELAPEMKALAEKYKNDMEKRTQAQRELFAKHNYNPFSGCLVTFFQVPVFIGLYRGLSVDVALRQTPLIPGLKWCSNLAGPDMFFHWEHILPGFLADRTGWLGPYLNVLPIITVSLFLVHQKLFTPPPTDEQQQMQQQMMKFMMLFMGVMFHKVAAGLCIYFIASSLWGLAERLLLPKSKPGGGKPVLAAAGGGLPVPDGNGSEAARKRRKQRRG